MKFRDLTDYGKILAGLLIVLAFLTGIMGTAIYFAVNAEPDQKPWIKALVFAGYDMNTTVQLLSLPDRPILITDSLGFQKATGAFLYKQVDENGEPLLAVYYLANKVLLDKLPKPKTPDALGPEVLRDSTDTGDEIR